MTLPNIEDQARGWIPENPKTSKRKLKRIYASAAILFSTMVLVSVFSSAFLVQLATPSTLVLPAYVHMSTTNPPFSTYVEFQGILETSGESYSIIDGVYQKLEPVFHIIFSNGSKANCKALNMSFSTNAESYTDNNFQVNVALTADNFSAQKTLDGTMVNGKLTVNSKTSLFMIDPHLLVGGTEIVLGETADWKLVGDISNSTWKLQTAIEDYMVEAVGVLMYHSTKIAPTGWLMLHLGFDTKTGMLVSATGALTDVLLDAAGIQLITDGNFKLVGYSENLNLEVIQPPQIPADFPFWIILAVTIPVVIVIAAALAYRAHKRKADLSLALRELSDYPESGKLSSRAKSYCCRIRTRAERMV